MRRRPSPRAAEAVPEADRADPAAGEAGSRCAAGAEAAADAGEARACQARSGRRSRRRSSRKSSGPTPRSRSEAPPAPRTSAPPRAERQAPAASATSAGAAASAMAAYNQRVRAHLMRFHQYPSSGNGQRGVARLVFTLSRKRPGAVEPPRRLIGRCGARCPGHGDGPPGLAIPGISRPRSRTGRCPLTCRWSSSPARRHEAVAYSFTAPVSDDT